MSDEWQHTLLKVPDRPSLHAAAESGGVGREEENGAVEQGSCPGAAVRFFAIEDRNPRDTGDRAPSPRPTLDPEPAGACTVPEQDEENCGPNGWEPGAVEPPGWLSPHYPPAFLDVAFATYYGVGLRAIGISDPSEPVEAGRFVNEPMPEVRWESYGVRGDREHGPDGKPVRQPVAESTHPFAFSYPVVHDGYVIFADVQSGSYALEYDGPHAGQVPAAGTCLAPNPDGVDPGDEPCAPYGETGWAPADGASS